MITVTRLNGKKYVINAELIRSVEENPDTTIQMINGDHLIVKESMQRVVGIPVSMVWVLQGLIVICILASRLLTKDTSS